jgi:hypothetical protein
MSRSEKAHLNDTLVAVSALPRTLVWRNNTGMAWQGEPMNLRVGSMLRIEAGMTLLRNARPIRFGLTGSADVIGAQEGRPVAIEMKDEDGNQKTGQKLFEEAWVKAGGLYVLARSAEEALDSLVI